MLPRVYARPLELYRGQSMGAHQLIDRLNDLGYAQRARVEKPGEFAIGRDTIILLPRDGTAKGRLVRVNFDVPKPPKTPTAPLRVRGLEVDDKATPRVTLDPPLLTGLINAGREKRRRVALSSIPSRMVQAVLAIEDRRFYDHPGVDVIRTVGAVITNMRGDRPYLVGGSTITQQLVKNFFLTPEKSLKRKLAEQYMALILERKASKDEILELYLNDVYLGQRGSFAVHGVAEAARLFFGKDVTNLSLSEAATIAGVIQSPYYWSPFASPGRCRDRRNTVLHAMLEEEFISADAASRTSSEPIEVVQRALDAQAPYFIDVVGQSLAEQFPQLSSAANRVEVFTTLDLHLQRLAQDALREGLGEVDAMLAKRKQRGRAQAALIAVDPRTGEVLALVGGRSYNQSQFNRAVAARRQPGSVFKPFVYLSAFELAAQEGRTDLDAGHARQRRADDLQPGHRPGVGAGQLRGRIRRDHHAAPGARAVAQHRHDQGRRDRRLPARRRAVGSDGRRDERACVSLDHARRVRGLAVRDRDGLHNLSERRHTPPAARPLARRRQRRVLGGA